MIIFAVTLIILSLAAGFSRSAPGAGTIEAWAARTSYVPCQLTGQWLPATGRVDFTPLLALPRVCAGRTLPAQYSASPEWDELVREVLGRPSIDSWAEALYPSGRPVAL